MTIDYDPETQAVIKFSFGSAQGKAMAIAALSAFWAYPTTVSDPETSEPIPNPQSAEDFIKRRIGDENKNRIITIAKAQAQASAEQQVNALFSEGGVE